MLLPGPVKDRGGIKFVQDFAGPTQHGLVQLTDIHTGRHTERIEDNIYRGTVLHEGHIFLGHDHRDNTLVTVATSHLITHGNLALIGNVDFHQLDDTGL